MFNLSNRRKSFRGGAPADDNTLTLNGTDQYVSYPHSTVFDSMGDFTMTGFINFTSAPDRFPPIINKWGGAGSRGFQLRFDRVSDEIEFFYSFDGTTQFSQIISWVPVDMTWYMVSVGRSNTDLQFYINGATLGSTINIGSSTLNNPSGVFLGLGASVAAPTNTHLQGSIAFPKIYTKNLGASGLLELYNSGEPKCFDDLSVLLSTDVVFAPDASNFGGNTGSELLDRSPSALVGTGVNSPTFTDLGLVIDCT